ncbi:MAG: hypothetical protein WBO24_14730 [Nitrospirales bacterium]
MITSLMVGMVGSLLASFLFLYFMRRHVPQVRIAEQIAICTNSDRHLYQIKVINMGKDPIINVKAQLLVAHQDLRPGGTTPTTKKLDLDKEELFELQGYDPSDKEDGYCFRFTAKNTEAIDAEWQGDDKYLIFQLIATHSISHFSKVFKGGVNEKYYRSYSAKRGCFKTGPSVEIIERNIV